MNYKEAIAYIENTGKFGINLGLKRIERLCELLEVKESDLKVIHIAGTNGKGSTTTFISNMLMSEGYKVGIYTSPYIERFTERIKINETEISETEVAEYVELISGLVAALQEEGLEHPTEFELITALALRYFKDKGVDFVVLEVGLGGRFDATNIITPLISVITSISYDHVNILGDTLEKIAYEKAGIIKKGVPVVCYPQKEEAMKVIETVADEMNARIIKVSEGDFKVLKESIDGIEFNYNGETTYENLKISMVAPYQVLNATTALRTIEELKGLGVGLKDESVYEGLEAARWPGRFEIISQNPYVILDGAHNQQGIDALVEALEKNFKNKKIHIVCGILRDKDYMDMAGKLAAIGESFVTVKPDNDRALSAEELKCVFEKLGKKAEAANDIDESVKKGLELVDKEEVLVFCGSLYMIGAVRLTLRRYYNF